MTRADSHVAKVRRGQLAWSRIKSTAAEQRELWRELWREIGEALLVGRRLHKADRAFAAWCADHGFDDMRPNARGDAMWLAENWSTVTVDLDADLTHPTNIRQAHRETLADTPPSPDLAVETPARLVADIEVVAPIAKTVNKLAAMAERGEGQEQATAQKYLAKKAKDLGMDAEELTGLAAKLEPTRHVPPRELPALTTSLRRGRKVIRFASNRGRTVRWLSRESGG